MSKINQKDFNALVSKQIVNRKGKTYTNLVCTVLLNNGDVVSFEFSPKFYNHKFDYKLKQNINEVK